MCEDCGCQEGNARAYFDAHGHDHDHSHAHGHDHGHGAGKHVHTHVTVPAGTEVHIHIHVEGAAEGGHHHHHAHPHVHGDETHSHQHHHNHEHAHDHGHGHHHHDQGHDHDGEHHGDAHHHGHDRSHAHDHGPATAGEKRTRTVELETKVLAVNDELAEKNRSWLKERGIVAVNMISSPGTGKTYLLERTLEALKGKVRCAVIAGDQKTDNDARRLMEKGAPVIQIETQASCHLNAQQVGERLEEVAGDGAQLLFIENVGNLVCPAAFDLGEAVKIALLSVTEGEDKPLKYPVLFHDAPVSVVTKMDLVPHLDVEVEKCRASIKTVRPDARIFELSAKTGDGMDAWIAYLTGLVGKG